ncbi:hypothetical protein NKG05_27755 [Oerskovia sp. M15]
MTASGSAAPASTNASLVIQRVKTNVVTTALNAAEPQSHSDQARTWRRPPATRPARPGRPGRGWIRAGVGCGGVTFG